MDVLLKSMGEEIVKLVSPKHFSIEQKNFVKSVEYSVNVISSQTDIVFGSQNHPLFFTSRWISVNVIMLDSHHVLVEEDEHDLI